MRAKLSLIAERINKQLRVQPPIKPIHVEYIYRACGFEVSFFGNTSTWCSLLTDNDILVLEYFADLRNYYTYSYGSSLNSKLACQLVTSIVRSVDSFLKGISNVKATFKFGHAETIYFLITLLVRGTIFKQLSINYLFILTSFTFKGLV